MVEPRFHRTTARLLGVTLLILGGPSWAAGTARATSKGAEPAADLAGRRVIGAVVLAGGAGWRFETSVKQACAALVEAQRSKGPSATHHGLTLSDLQRLVTPGNKLLVPIPRGGRLPLELTDRSLIAHKAWQLANQGFRSLIFMVGDQFSPVEQEVRTMLQRPPFNDLDPPLQVSFDYPGFRLPTGLERETVFQRLVRITQAWPPEEHFFVTAGDTLSPAHAGRLLEQHLAHGKPVTLAAENGGFCQVTGDYWISAAGLADYAQKLAALYAERAQDPSLRVYDRARLREEDSTTRLYRFLRAKNHAVFVEGFAPNLNELEDYTDLIELLRKGLLPWLEFPEQW